MLPQVNARLVSIQSEGASEDWDVAAASGTAKWSGSVGAYVIEKVTTNFSQSQGALVKNRDINIIIPNLITDPSGSPITIATGDIVTYLWKGNTHTRKVMEYTGPDFPGVAKYLRLHLEPMPLEKG